ncbi:general vesicular transport factor p115 [Condylostylus longicornis]|uniref:general vesicular transport factor p115 n=1 Tax=Condylostylus longicornis TaxID=2530218 RepID=UPI00244DB506|nr:general vesicular transport factor p115 [Condylostylus longicornis]
MDFLKSGLKTVLGTQEPGQQPSGAETVERLVDRVNSSTLLDDRRDACRALKALSRKYRIEVGAQGMSALIQVLQMDRTDNEIVGYALDSLCNVMSPEQFDEEADNPTVSINVGEQFTEMFIKTPENATVALSYLEEYDFQVRWSAIKLITTLLANKTKEIQEIVLVSPMGVSKLMDLLVDSREVIRNDALLLLIQLTKGNANIQKIVAFENAFDRLFDIIRDEGCSDGGIVVEDCLILMINLLKNNSSNQQFFKEGSYIQRLSPMFKISPETEETGWTPQKVSNMHCMLQVVRSLVSPSNQFHVIASCQRDMRVCGLLEALANILMGSGVPADILTETINTVGEVMRGDISNQEYFSTITAPSNPPRPAVVVLLMSMVNEKQPLTLRCAVLYSFECFFYKNEIGQAALVQTLLPSSSEVSNLTTGQLLCGGLFSTDVLANWFSAVALMHGLLDNSAQKEQLLRVLLATSPGSQPVSLLQQCTQLLQQGKYKLQSKIGLLMLLSTWLSHCPVAVKAFLSAPGCIAYLLAQIGANEHDENEYLVQGLCTFLMGICIQFNDNSLANYKKEDICQLIIKRIGLEYFIAKLGDVSKHEAYSRAAKQPQIRIKSSSELLLDYEFCKLFKTLEASISKMLNYCDPNSANLTELTLSSEASDLVGQYKDVIRGLDTETKTLKEKLQILEKENDNLKIQIANLQLSNAQFSDQNILLKAQLTAASASNNHEAIETINVTQTRGELEFYRSANVKMVEEIDSLQGKLIAETEKVRIKEEELEKLHKDQENLLELLTDQENKISRYCSLLREAGHPVESDEECDDEELDSNDITENKKPENAINEKISTNVNCKSESIEHSVN